MRSRNINGRLPLLWLVSSFGTVYFIFSLVLLQLSTDPAPTSLGDREEHMERKLRIPTPKNTREEVNTKKLQLAELARQAVFRKDKDPRHRMLGVDPANGNNSSHENEDHLYKNPMCKSLNQTFLRPTHGCQSNPVSSMPHCHMQLLRIDTSKINYFTAKKGLRKTGAKVFPPNFQPGAFSILQDLNLSTSLDRSYFYYMNQVLKATTIHDELECNETWTGTTLLIARYEHANLYHTLMDWWNTFYSLPSQDYHHQEPVNVVFLDAHVNGTLDDVWKDLFGNTTSVRDLPTGGVCLQDATLVSAGYTSPISGGSQDLVPYCPNKTQMTTFVNFLLSKYDLQELHRIPGKILLLDETASYPPHSQQGKLGKEEQPDRVIAVNLNALRDRLLQESIVSSVETVSLAGMSMAEQIRMVREAHILIVTHAQEFALSHLVFLEEQTHVLEFESAATNAGMSRPIGIFEDLCDWKEGVTHHMLPPIMDDGTLSSSRIDEVVALVVESVSKDHFPIFQEQ
jgi:hypothetical protein